MMLTRSMSDIVIMLGSSLTLLPKVPKSRWWCWQKTVDTAAGSHPPAPPETADHRFVDETRQLILILVKTDHKTEAGHIRERALALVNDPQFKSVVTDAERGLVRQ